VTKAELGTKRLCPNCGARYYDLNRSPIICPKCGTLFEVASGRARPQASKAVKEPVVEEAEEVAPVELVSLEEADEEAAEGTAKKPGADDEDDAEVEGEEDDTFLAEEEEDEEDVGDIIGDVDEEER
jgi:uncharacterized protein (TIGR02300 family)